MILVQLVHVHILFPVFLQFLKIIIRCKQPKTILLLTTATSAQDLPQTLLWINGLAMTFQRTLPTWSSNRWGFRDQIASLTFTFWQHSDIAYRHIARSHLPFHYSGYHWKSDWLKVLVWSITCWNLIRSIDVYWWLMKFSKATVETMTKKLARIFIWSWCLENLKTVKSINLQACKNCFATLSVLDWRDDEN